MQFATKAIHSGGDADAATGAIMPPIFMTSTYVQKAPAVTVGGYDYTRAGNPNFTVLEKTLAALENADHATVFSSGLGALTALLATLKAGDGVLALNGLYGGTFRLFKEIFDRFGIRFDNRSGEDIEGMKRALDSGVSWLLLETPTNPLMEIADIEQLCREAKERGVKTVVDNTFATPYFQNPLLLGSDAVWHSTTKYIGGHSDVVGGAIITNNSTLKEKLDFSRKAMGLNPSPFDTWLTLRGTKTLALRMERHNDNAMKAATFLQSHPKVLRVYYPGLESHTGHAVAAKQMRGFSGMVSAEFKLDIEEVKKLIASFSLFSLAESLGGVESLVCHPATMTHASIPAAERKRMGITDGLVRFSVGIEDSDDQLADLARALDER